KHKEILHRLRMQVQSSHEAGILAELTQPPGSSGTFSVDQYPCFTEALAVNVRLIRCDYHLLRSIPPSLICSDLSSAVAGGCNGAPGCQCTDRESARWQCSRHIET